MTLEEDGEVMFGEKRSKVQNYSTVTSSVKQ